MGKSPPLWQKIDGNNRPTPICTQALGIMGALFQHSYTSAIQGRWGFLALGLLIWPVGILNGLGLWLGLW
jgi:hypothetical protein